MHGKKRLAAFFLSGVFCAVSLFGAQRPAAAYDADELVPVGHTVGLKLFAEGVVVVGLAEVESGGSLRTPGADCGLEVGDVIDRLNGRDVDTAEDFARMLQCAGPVELSVNRDGRGLTLTADPVEGSDGVRRLGAWIRDSMAGIGTITFYDPATGIFGALGHGVTDADTGRLMPLGDGAVMDASVKAVKRGRSGEPGELKGSFDLTGDLGALTANTDRGVFGSMETCDFLRGEAVPVAAPGEVRAGEASIMSNVVGDGVEEYSIEIVRVSGDGGPMLLRVTDETLIERTGGIVQGMSGSPILQDGRLVGAVTHVMVSDPTRGYGILIEDMLSAADEALA